MKFIYLITLVTLFSCQKSQPNLDSTKNYLVQTKYYREDVQAIAPTPLHLAVLERNLEQVKLLVQNGYDINTPNSKFGETPLQLALELQDFAISEYLALFPNLDIYHKNLEEEGYLFTASKNGHFRVIQILFDRHRKFNNLIREIEYKNFDYPNKKGQRALHVALNAETAEALRLSGYWSTGRLFDKDKDGYTPLHQAVIDQRHTILIWASKTYCRPYDEYFRHSVLPKWINAFLSSGLKEGVELIRWISPKFRWEWYSFIAANPFNYPDPKGNTPVHLAALSQSPGLVEAALSCRYSNLSQTNIEKQTPLHLSAQSINPDVLKAVLNGKLIHTWWNQRSEWLNKVDKAGNTALHYAALNLSQGESYRMLLEAGVNPKITDAKGQTPDQLFKASSQQRKLNRSYRDL